METGSADTGEIMKDEQLEKIFGKPTPRHREVFTRFTVVLSVLLILTVVTCVWLEAWIAAAVQCLFTAYVLHSLITQIRWRKRNGEW